MRAFHACVELLFFFIIAPPANSVEPPGFDWVAELADGSNAVQELVHYLLAPRSPARQAILVAGSASSDEPLLWKTTGADARPSPTPLTTEEHSDERAALIDFYEATHGPTSWRWNWNWDTAKPVCRWLGVTCDGHGRVLELSLPPANRLSGRLPSSLSNLSQMKTFRVSHNNLTGTLPPELSVWQAIEIFMVNDNSLHGTLPPEYGVWPFEYDVDRGLTPLVELSVNELTGSLPSSYGNWSFVSVFAASRNQLTGQMPASWRHWGNVRYLNINANALSGTLPVEYSAWDRLIWLALDSNPRLGGAVRWYRSFLLQARSRYSLLLVKNNICLSLSLPTLPVRSCRLSTRRLAEWD